MGLARTGLNWAVLVGVCILLLVPSPLAKDTVRCGLCRLLEGRDKVGIAYALVAVLVWRPLREGRRGRRAHSPSGALLTVGSSLLLELFQAVVAYRTASLVHAEATTCGPGSGGLPLCAGSVGNRGGGSTSP